MRFLALVFSFLCLTTALPAEDKVQPASPGGNTRKVRAKDVYDLRHPIIFQDDFSSGSLEHWAYSENDQYRLQEPTPKRIQIVDAPNLGEGAKAVRMVVERAPNSFRSEISLPSERGFNERWYAARLLIPTDWVFDPLKAADIVIQWHGVPGNWEPTHPNLAIAIVNDRWHIRQSFGSPQEGPTRTSTRIAEPIERGRWVSWIVHAKWSPAEDGLLQVWKDGALVLNRKGPNVYGTIGVAYTPYLKTGIYRPEWHLDDEKKREAFEKENPGPMIKSVYVTDIKIGDARAGLQDFAPKSETAHGGSSQP